MRNKRINRTHRNHMENIFEHLRNLHVSVTVRPNLWQQHGKIRKDLFSSGHINEAENHQWRPLNETILYTYDILCTLHKNVTLICVKKTLLGIRNIWTRQALKCNVPNKTLTALYTGNWASLLRRTKPPRQCRRETHNLNVKGERGDKIG